MSEISRAGQAILDKAANANQQAAAKSAEATVGVVNNITSSVTKGAEAAISSRGGSRSANATGAAGAGVSATR